MAKIEVRPASEVRDYLAGELIRHLAAGETVLWLVPGGSAMQVAVDVMNRIPVEYGTQLNVTLTDERYGSQGHDDENWRQLDDLGFDSSGARTYRVLDGTEVDETTRNYGAQLRHWLESADFRAGLFGIGPDGHTAGIKPESAAVTARGLAANYIGMDFERVTVTPKAIAELDLAVAYATGREKWTTLERLVQEDLPIVDQPAQSLKAAGRTVLFSDLKV